MAEVEEKKGLYSSYACNQNLPVHFQVNISGKIGFLQGQKGRPLELEHFLSDEVMLVCRS